MFYTLTTNPAIDMNICCNGIMPRKVNRTFDAEYCPNGKGLNVTFVLGHFGIESTVLGFFGGFSGEYIVKETRKRGYAVQPVWVEDTTRINIFLNDGSDEYKFVNNGSFVSKERQDLLLQMIEASEDMDYLSVSGSLPCGIDESFYDHLLQICKKKNVDVIMDISAPKLRELLPYRPLLIKPNDEELKEIFGLSCGTEEEAILALYELHRMGAQNILLTLGARGSYFYNGYKVYYADTQPVKLLSSACAGDAALAAFLSIWLNNPHKVEEAMRLSAATGANVAESNAIGTLERVEEYKTNIKVREVTDYGIGYDKRDAG